MFNIRLKYNQWKAPSVVQTYIQKHALQAPAKLQVHFTNGTSKWFSSKRKRIMSWNESTGSKLHEYPSSTDTAVQNEKLAKNTIVHCWKGDCSLIKEAIENGYDIVNTYHEYIYLDYDYKKIPLEKAYHFNPVPEKVDSRTAYSDIRCQLPNVERIHPDSSKIQTKPCFLE